MPGKKRITPVPIKESLTAESGGVGSVEYIRFFNDLRGNVSNLLNEIDALKKARAGSIFYRAGDSAPDGALVCDGSSLSKAEYPDLFEVIGYTWGGSGDNFNIPNQEKNGFGLFIRGETAAAKVGDFIDHSVEAHEHDIDHDHESFTSGNESGHHHSYQNYPMYAAAALQAGTDYDVNDSSPHTHDTGGSSGHTHNINVPEYTGVSGTFGKSETAPKAIVMNLCIWSGK